MCKKHIILMFLFCSLLPMPACKMSSLNPTVESEIATDKGSACLNTNIYTNPEVYDNISDYDKKIVTEKKRSLEYSLKSKDKKSVVSNLTEMSRLYDDFAILVPKSDQENKAKKISAFAKKCAKLVESGERLL